MSPDPRLESIEAVVQGRYWVREAHVASGAPVLVGFHGYGEDAESLMAEINLIPGILAWKLIAIQGLHPFYRTRTGEVVASWMTRLDRESAIRNNIRYVQGVLDKEFAAEGRKTTLVMTGFSQGTAMAYRAAAGVERRCDAVVSLGGDVPPELRDGQLEGLPVALVARGVRDEWYGEDKLAQDLEVLRSQGVDARPVRFDGGHEWTDGFRATLGRFLAGLLPEDEGPSREMGG
jgi:predicted esterase